MKTCKAAQEKKDLVEYAKKLIKDYPIIGIVNLSTLPAATYAKMRAKMRDKATFLMARKTLIVRALQESKLPNVDKIIEQLKGVPALLFTKDNPFAIYKTIKKGKTPAAAKAGQEAPYDIVLPPGPTPFPPGPIISEFAQLGVQAGVEGGKVAIKQESTVAKEGDIISATLASMLMKLDIKPMEIGLNLAAVYEDGIIYDRKVLDIDEEQFLADLQQAASEGINLAVDVVYPSKDTSELLIQKAFREAKAVALEGGVMEPEIVEEVLAKGAREANAIANASSFEPQ